MVKKVYFNKSGTTGGITCKINVPKDMLRAIGVDEKEPYVEIIYNDELKSISILKSDKKDRGE